MSHDQTYAQVLAGRYVPLRNSAFRRKRESLMARQLRGA
jgi:hypothetical protein